MSGLVKQKEYDWKDSNVAKLGSSEDREVSCQCLFKLRRNIDILGEVWCNLKNFEEIYEEIYWWYFQSTFRLRNSRRKKNPPGEERRTS